MPTDHEADPTFDESLTSVNKAAMKADEAIRDTAQKYIDKAGLKLDLKQVETKILRNPKPAIAIAAGAGFVKAQWSRAWAWRCLHCSAVRPPARPRPSAAGSGRWLTVVEALGGQTRRLTYQNEVRLRKIETVVGSGPVLIRRESGYAINPDLARKSWRS